MKITTIEPMLIALPYEHGAPKPALGSGQRRDLMDAVYLRVETEDGLVGWGEAFGFGACRIAYEAVKLVIAPAAVGRDSADIAETMTQLFRGFQGMALNGPIRFALSGLDIALWDIAGKREGKPVHELLGGARRDRVPAYASLLRMERPPDVAKVSAEAARRGYRHIKLHQRTTETVAAARHSVGPDVALMLDTNCAWDADGAVAMAKSLRQYDLAWLEEPVYPPNDFDALARVRAEGGIPVSAGENLGSMPELRRAVERGALDIVQPDSCKFGGITEMMKAVEFCAGSDDVALDPHSPLYGPGLVATLHILAAMETEAMVEFYFCDLGASPMGDAIAVTDGFMAVPQGPGLGVDPDEDVIARYRVM